MSPRRLISVPLALGMLLFALSLIGARSAAAQGGAPNFANFGYPTVLATGNYVPGTAMTITGGGQEVILPADFISKTVKFELLGGDTNAWAGMLPADAAGRQVTAAFAFRVTDANGTIVGRFDKPVIWSITSPLVAPNADIYNTTAANPPVVTKNGTPPTLDGQKLSHSFGGAGVGWLAVNPAGVTIISPANPATPVPSAPNFANFGYPTVLATGNFVPGTAMTITGGGQEVILPADFISKTVKFELLGGDTNAWAGMLPADAAGRQVTAAFAFRVTDANGTIVGRFDKPVIWSITSAAVMAGSDIYNTTAANPPVVTKNGTPPTLDGPKLSHSFGGAGVGWLAVNPVAVAVPVGMPVTGAPFGLDQMLLLAACAGLLLLASGLLLRRARASR